MASQHQESVATFERMSEVAGRAQQMMLEFWATESGRMMDGASADTLPAGEAFTDMLGTWQDWMNAWASTDPEQLQKLSGEFWTDSLRLWTGVLSGNEAEIPDPARVADKRFKANQWSEQPVFDLVRRTYLLASHYLLQAVGTLDGVPQNMRDRLRFQARQFVDAMSPANFAALNPEVIETAIESRGESLLRGLQYLLEDLRRGKLTMTDENAFQVGGNIATTPGKVVFENRIFQLIHYAPAGGKVHEIPLLIFPAWINKFYILDLTQEKSLVRWAVERGYDVFIVSWRQGCAELADMTLDSYVLEGQLTAIDTVRQITRAPAVHTVGYCVAGSTLAVTLAWLAARGQAEKVRSATFLTAQVDFSEAGDLLNLVDEHMMVALDAISSGRGYVDGRWLATSFNVLRPTDLIWNYVVNNYLKGKDYIPFDLLYWNSDCTNVPARWHRDYMQQFYRDNLLVRPGAVSVDGTAIDLSAVHTPVYIQAGVDDHIAPAVSAFKLTRTFSGPSRFLLAGSGHIAGVVNPPGSGKYQHWVLPADAVIPETLPAFREQATEVKGSWWPDWDAWLAPQSGDMVPARIPGTASGFPAIEDAPGRYVRERVA